MNTIILKILCWINGIKNPFVWAAESELPNGGWIPVNVRLPEFNDIVLASTDSDYDELKIILTVYNAEEYWFNGKVKAWMPLPEPYKESER